MRDLTELIPGGCAVITVVGLLSAVPAWLTHVVTCINNEQYVFLVVGAIMWPIGVMHGWSIWFGVW